MERYQNFARYLTVPGTLVALPTIAVYERGTLTPATLYADNLTIPTPLGNPFLGDANGGFFFYAENGYYDVQVSGGAPAIPVPYVIGDVELDDQPYRDINVLALGADPTFTVDSIEAFNQAVVLAKANHAGIYIPPGHYKLSTRWDLEDYRALVRGAGLGKVLLDWPSTNASWGIRVRPTLIARANDVAASRLEGFDVNTAGASTDAYGICLRDAYRMTIEDVHVIGAGVAAPAWLLEGASYCNFTNCKAGTGDESNPYINTQTVARYGWQMRIGVLAGNGSASNVFNNCTANYTTRQGWLLDSYVVSCVWLGGEINFCGTEAPGYFAFDSNEVLSGNNTLIGVQLENNGLPGEAGTNAERDIRFANRANIVINIHNGLQIRLAAGAIGNFLTGGDCSIVVIDAGANFNTVHSMTMVTVVGGGIQDGGEKNNYYGNWNFQTSALLASKFCTPVVFPTGAGATVDQLITQLQAIGLLNQV